MALPLKYNFRSLWVRWVSTIMTVVGIALVVGVFIVVSALAHGLRASFVRTGDPATVLVMRQGANAELESFAPLANVEILRNLDGVVRGEGGEPLASPEHFILVVVPRTKGGSTNLSVRGIGAIGLGLRPNFKITEGRMFQPGVAELIVSKNIAGRFQNTRVGDTLELSKRSFQVVGVFDTGGTAYDSEVWGDAPVIGETFRRLAGYSTVRLKTTDAKAAERLSGVIKEDARLASLQTIAEPAYFDKQTSSATPVMAIGIVVSVLLGVGAIFGAMNTLYAAVSSRVREIATLRAIGFGRFSILLAFLIEALCLAVMGGILGTILALPFNGIATGTINWQTFGEAAFAFEITPFLALLGVLFALLMGLVGGVPPAFRAARRPVAQALREL